MDEFLGPFSLTADVDAMIFLPGMPVSGWPLVAKGARSPSRATITLPR